MRLQLRRLRLNSLACVILAIALLAPRQAPSDPGAQRQVATIEQFKVHIRSHVRRVQLLGAELVRQNPERYRGIRREALLEFLGRHDASKLIPHFTARLWENYGLGMKNQLFKDTVTTLNRSDKEIMRRWLVRNGFTDRRGRMTELGEKLLEIERLADSVDRGLSDVSPEEFNRPMNRASLTTQDPLEAERLARLEDAYADVTRGNSYQDWLGLDRRKLRACYSNALRNLTRLGPAQLRRH